MNGDKNRKGPDQQALKYHRHGTWDMIDVPVSIRSTPDRHGHDISRSRSSNHSPATQLLFQTKPPTRHPAISEVCSKFESLSNYNQSNDNRKSRPSGPVLKRAINQAAAKEQKTAPAPVHRDLPAEQIKPVKVEETINSSPESGIDAVSDQVVPKSDEVLPELVEPDLQHSPSRSSTEILQSEESPESIPLQCEESPESIPSSPEPVHIVSVSVQDETELSSVSSWSSPSHDSKHSIPSLDHDLAETESLQESVHDQDEIMSNHVQDSISESDAEPDTASEPAVDDLSVVSEEESLKSDRHEIASDAETVLADNLSLANKMAEPQPHPNTVDIEEEQYHRLETSHFSDDDESVGSGPMLVRNMSELFERDDDHDDTTDTSGSESSSHAVSHHSITKEQTVQSPDDDILHDAMRSLSLDFGSDAESLPVRDSSGASRSGRNVRFVDGSVNDQPQQSEARLDMFEYPLIKHGRRGRRRRIYLTVDLGAGIIRWGNGRRWLQIERILQVRNGKQTAVLRRRSADDVDGRLCLSLITRDRSLDLECKTAEERKAVQLTVMNQIVGYLRHHNVRAGWVRPRLQSS